MTAPPSVLHVVLDILSVVLDVAAALLAIIGTYWMAKRYAPNMRSGVKFAFLALWKYAKGLGSEVEQFYIDEVRANKDVPELPGTTAMGLNFLFVAFFLQLVKIIVALLATLV